MPLVTSHSRVSAARRSPQISRPKWTTEETACGTLFSALLDQLCDEASPSSLVIGADPGAVVAMEILVKEDQILPVGVRLEKFEAAGDRAAAVFAANEDMNKP